MSGFPATKAKKVLAALLRLGWTVKRQTGTHKTLSREGWSDVVFAFHDGDEIGPKMMPALPRKRGFLLPTSNLTSPAISPMSPSIPSDA